MTHQVVKTLAFCYGHRLTDYSGKCKNLHGHNGRLEITLQKERLDKLGMVVDFVEIKEKIKAWVDEALDHRMLISSKDPMLSALKAADPTVVAVDFNPTAENIARMIFEKVKSLGFPVTEVRLWETDTSCAVFKNQG